jgi:hypothetical protein
MFYRAPPDRPARHNDFNGKSKESLARSPNTFELDVISQLRNGCRFIPDRNTGMKE